MGNLGPVSSKSHLETEVAKTLSKIKILLEFIWWEIKIFL